MSATAGQVYARSIIPDAVNREADDFYKTDPRATAALCRVERFEGVIHDPCCGDGAIAQELEAAGYTVTAHDLVDRGYGQPRVDFLMERERHDNIVMNPPFKLAREFIDRALSLADRKVVSLARLGFLEGKSRKPWFEATPLARVWIFSGRITMHRGGFEQPRASMLAFAWFVWDHAHKGPPTLGWIEPVAVPIRGKTS